MFIEVKANFTKSQVRLLADAGVILFPGIESLSTDLLRLVRKGCSAPQNIQILKWCCELGIPVMWNFLYGFPGEDPSEYEKMTALIPRLVHLPPPTSIHKIILTRSSPYHCNPDEFGIKNIRPADIYNLLYPFPEDHLMRLAYYFDFDYSDGRNVESYIDPLRERVKKLWLRENLTGSLHYTDNGDTLRIIDNRPAAIIPFVELANLERELYLFCDSFHRRHQINKLIIDHGGSPTEMEPFFESMVSNGMMLDIDDGFLSLAVRPQRAYLTAESINGIYAHLYPPRSVADPELIRTD